MTTTHHDTGKKGAEACHNKDDAEESAIARKAAETRKEHDPDAFRKMGQKGEQAQHEGQSRRDDVTSENWQTEDERRGKNRRDSNSKENQNRDRNLSNNEDKGSDRNRESENRCKREEERAHV